MADFHNPPGLNAPSGICTNSRKSHRPERLSRGGSRQVRKLNLGEVERVDLKSCFCPDLPGFAALTHVFGGL